MLGQVSGQDYIANRKLALGDSDHGEYIDIVPTNTAERLAPDQPISLPEPKADEGDTNGD